MNTPTRLVYLLVSLTLSSGLAGCSFLASLFPDKQKQYQYSTEIPPLEIPSGLTASTIEGVRQSRQAVRETGGGDVMSPDQTFDSSSVVGGLPPLSPEMARAASEPQQPEPEAEAEARSLSGRYVLAENADGTPLIEISEPYPVAWNSVGRALGRLRLKISDQNRSDGLYYVHPGERDESAPEHGLLSELFGYLTGKPVHGEEYRLRLEDRGETTYVTVVDAKNQPLTGDEGLELLKRLQEGLQKSPTTRREEDEEQP